MQIIKTIGGTGKESMKSLVGEIEQLVVKNVKLNYPSSWDAGSISGGLFKDLCGLIHGKKISVPGSIIQTRCSLHELEGDRENQSDDLAIIAKIRYHDGYSVEGVAFFEAGLRDPEKTTFSTIRKDHTRRLKSHSPFSQMLLFDYDSITGMAFPTVAESVIGNYPHTWSGWVPFTHAAVVPVNNGLALGARNTGLYKTSVPFSYQFCYRYFYGLDLDYQAPALELARGTKPEKGSARHLVLLSVAHGGAEPDEAFEYDKAKYREVL